MKINEKRDELKATETIMATAIVKVPNQYFSDYGVLSIRERKPGRFVLERHVRSHLYGSEHWEVVGHGLSRDVVELKDTAMSLVRNSCGGSELTVISDWD